MSDNTLPFTLVFALGVALASPLHAADSPPPAQKRPPVSVTTAIATRMTVPFKIDAIGSVQPVATVQLRARVDAQVDSVLVADGAAVSQGDILVKLDSRQIEAQIKQAAAILQRDKAQLEMNERDVRRYSELVDKKSTPIINMENAKTAAATTRANIASDEAALETLKVQASYYTLRAPISGKIGAFSIKAGNIARGGDNTPAGVIATIHQVSPIYVAVAIPQRYLADLRLAMANGVSAVSVKPQGAKAWIEGKIAVIDNAIDAATGMLTVRALFENKDEALWPGQLCDVSITLRNEKDVLTVPREAVQIGQKGSYVFVVAGEGATARPVSVIREQAGRALIGEGLQAGETIAVDGANILTTGSTVTIRKPENKGDAS